jgi:hypothetical protein
VWHNSSLALSVLVDHVACCGLPSKTPSSGADMLVLALTADAEAVAQVPAVTTSERNAGLGLEVLAARLCKRRVSAFYPTSE